MEEAGALVDLSPGGAACGLQGQLVAGTLGPGDHTRKVKEGAGGTLQMWVFIRGVTIHKSHYSVRTSVFKSRFCTAVSLFNFY